MRDYREMIDHHVPPIQEQGDEDKALAAEILQFAEDNPHLHPDLVGDMAALSGTFNENNVRLQSLADKVESRVGAILDATTPLHDQLGDAISSIEADDNAAKDREVAKSLAALVKVKEYFEDLEEDEATRVKDAITEFARRANDAQSGLGGLIEDVRYIHQLAGGEIDEAPLIEYRVGAKRALALLAAGALAAVTAMGVFEHKVGKSPMDAAQDWVSQTLDMDLADAPSGDTIATEANPL